jgi:hypothetical protein
MRQVRVQGCLPSLAVLLVIAALGAVAFTAGLAVVLVTAGLLALVTVGRAIRRLFSAGPPAGGGPGAGVEAVPPGWLERGDGLVVEAEPRGPAGAEPGSEDGPLRDDERILPPRG